MIHRILVNILTFITEMFCLLINYIILQSTSFQFLDKCFYLWDMINLNYWHIAGILSFSRVAHIEVNKSKYDLFMILGNKCVHCFIQLYPLPTTILISSHQYQYHNDFDNIVPFGPNKYMQHMLKLNFSKNKSSK